VREQRGARSSDGGSADKLAAIHLEAVHEIILSKCGCSQSIAALDGPESLLVTMRSFND
jgi:hypothetical protein